MRLWLSILTQQELQPQFEPARAGDILHSQADISATHAALDYTPKVAWLDGLAQTLDFYRQQSA